MSLSTLHRRLLLRSISEVRTKCSSGLGSLKPFSISWPQQATKSLPPRRKLDDEDIAGSYLKGWGPGGQKINKTNSAVQLIHQPTGIVVKCQATRSQSQNRKIAHEILAEKVDILEKGNESRTAIKAALKRKRKASKTKKSRRKYRVLLEEKEKMEQMLTAQEDVQHMAADIGDLPQDGISRQGEKDGG